MEKTQQRYPTIITTTSYLVLLVVVSGATSYRPFNFQNKIPQRLDEKGSPIKANRKSVFNAAK